MSLLQVVLGAWGKGWQKIHKRKPISSKGGGLCGGGDVNCFSRLGLENLSSEPLLTLKVTQSANLRLIIVFPILKLVGLGVGPHWGPGHL